MYETSVEINMLKMMGADAVGLSAVPEVIVANAHGMRVLGISCITNMAAGLDNTPLDHRKVIHVATSIENRFSTFIRELIVQSSNPPTT